MDERYPSGRVDTDPGLLSAAFGMAHAEGDHDIFYANFNFLLTSDILREEGEEDPFELGKNAFEKFIEDNLAGDNNGFEVELPILNKREVFKLLGPSSFSPGEPVPRERKRATQGGRGMGSQEFLSPMYETGKINVEEVLSRKVPEWIDMLKNKECSDFLTRVCYCINGTSFKKNLDLLSKFMEWLIGELNLPKNQRIAKIESLLMDEQQMNIIDSLGCITPNRPNSTKIRITLNSRNQTQKGRRLVEAAFCDHGGFLLRGIYNFHS